MDIVEKILELCFELSIEADAQSPTDWLIVNPVLDVGFVAIEDFDCDDYCRLKFGDGKTKYTCLPYVLHL